MIKQEFLLINAEGTALYKAFSDKGYKIARNEHPELHLDSVINILDKTQPDLFIEIIAAEDKEIEISDVELQTMIKEVF